ncbi:MAG: T9SS type A sorting domain-containing protein [Crocinitomicaceae bacterium]
MLITSFIGQSTTFTLSQTSGSGSIGCSPCSPGTVLQIDHFIINNPSCDFLNDGSAAISVVNTLNGTPTNYPIANITWISPSGIHYIGGLENDTLTNMESGNWTIEVSDSCFNIDTYQFLLDAPIFPQINLQYANGFLTTDFSSYDSINTSYQWYKCNNDSLIGETNDSLQITSNGSYKLSISINDCISFSNCFNVIDLGVTEQNIIATIQPNPTLNSFSIFSKTQINNVKILNLGGQLIFQTKEYQNINITNFESGIYILLIESMIGRSVQKLIIQ